MSHRKQGRSGREKQQVVHAKSSQKWFQERIAEEGCTPLQVHTWGCPGWKGALSSLMFLKAPLLHLPLCPDLWQTLEQALGVQAFPHLAVQACHWKHRSCLVEQWPQADWTEPCSWVAERHQASVPVNLCGPSGGHRPCRHFQKQMRGSHLLWI